MLRHILKRYGVVGFRFCTRLAPWARRGAALVPRFYPHLSESVALAGKNLSDLGEQLLEGIVVRVAAVAARYAGCGPPRAVVKVRHLTRAMLSQA